MAFIIFCMGGLVALYAMLHCLLAVTQDPKEPVALATGIPFISPLLEMRKKAKFYINLRDKFNAPVYTLRLPFMRLYIINATELIPAAQKHYRILDFAPVEAKVAINVMGASPAGKKILVRFVNGVKDYSYAILFDKAIHPAVSPGPGLHAMNARSVRGVTRIVDQLASQTPQSLMLMDFMRKEIAEVTTEAVYGPQNPFADPKIQQAYWDFEPGIIALMLNLFPNVLARRSVQGRKAIVEALHHYFESDGHKQGSAFVQAHYQHKIDQGVSGRDIARFEIGGVVAILSNTVPTAFWVLYHVISEPSIMLECRAEVLACCTVIDDVVTLDITRIKETSSLLVSILKEVLRYHGIGTSVRLVTQDHMLADKYLLKKGGIVMIHGPVQHTSTSAYGDDVNVFEHKRFMRGTSKKTPSPVAFRGFGGGSTLCPGRHFASTEVVTFVAMMIARFDFEPVNGQWFAPTTANAGSHGTVAPPDYDIEVRLSRTTGKLADKKWVAIVSGSKESTELSVEDAF